MASGHLFGFFGSDSIPYFVRFSVAPAFIFPADFKTSRYPGLSVCHLIPAPPDLHLVTYWRDEPAYRASEASFCGALGLAAPDQSGLVSSIRREKDVWWKPKSLSAAVLAIAATFGALSAIRDYFAILFALPDVTLTYPDAGHVDALEGDQITIPLTALSGVRFASEKVRFDLPALNPNPQLPAAWTYDPPAIPALSAVQPQKVNITGNTPAHTGKVGSPDVYRMTVSSAANAGIISGIFFKGRTKAPEKEIWVWSSKPELTPLTFVRAEGTLCEFRGDLASPRAFPQGLSIEVKADGMPGEISSLNASAEAGLGMPVEISVDNSVFVAGARWSVLEKFRTYRYRVFIGSTKPTDRNSCEAWISKMRVAVK